MIMSNSSAFSIISILAEFSVICDFSSSTNLDTTDYFAKLNSTQSSDSQLVNDSRELNVGDIFCAVIGSGQDGREYIDQAIASGAILILAECQNEQQHGNILWRKASLSNESFGEQIAIIQFYQLNHQLFSLAKAYYQQPQEKLLMIGITGTNGKTSTSQLIAKLLDISGWDISSVVSLTYIVHNV